MGPRTEELWSYCIGLAPVGEEFWLRHDQIKQDLGFRTWPAISQRMTALLDEQIIKREGTSRFSVLRRMEDRHAA